MNDDEKRGFAAGIEAAARFHDDGLAEAEKREKECDARGEGHNAVGWEDRATFHFDDAVSIRALSPDASLVVAKREDLERLRAKVAEMKPPDSCPFCEDDNEAPCVSCAELARVEGSLASTVRALDAMLGKP